MQGIGCTIFIIFDSKSREGALMCMRGVCILFIEYISYYLQLVSPQTMPKEIKTPKQFLSLLKEGKSADKNKKAAKKTVFIKKNAKVTKFKIRRGSYLYTFKADKPNVIQAIESGLGKDVEKVEIKKRRVVAKKAKK